MSLRVRVILLALLIEFVTISLLVYAMLRISNHSITTQMTEDGYTIASSTLLTLRNRLSFDTSPEGLQEVVDGSSSDEAISYVCFIDANGVDIADSYHDDIGTSYWDDEATRLAIEQGITLRQTTIEQLKSAMTLAADDTQV